MAIVRASAFSRLMPLFLSSRSLVNGVEMIADVVALHVLVQDSAKAFFFFINFYKLFFSIPGTLSIPLDARVAMFCVDWSEFLTHNPST